MKNFRYKLRNALIFLTYYSGWPALRAWFYHWRKIPLLRVIAFHEIKDHQVGNFQKQLIFLKKHFQVISPNDFLANNFSSQKINFLLTFDDAYESWLKNVLPALKKENLSAIFFLDNRGLPLVGALQQAGQTIGGHTVGHSRLTKISPDELVFEIAENKKQLEQISGQPIVFFAYPFGDKQSFNQGVVDEVKKAGYQYGFTILPDFNKLKTNHYLLHRDSVDLNWNKRFLNAWLSGAYDVWK
ncbi:MAG: polysaccharide deacetylase family protein [Patescibacteria group bacterium]